MSEHKAARQKLAALVAGTLVADEEARVRAHLADCPECVRQERVWRSLLKALERIPETVPTQARLARIAALAQARREEVLVAKRARMLLTGLVLFGWAWFVVAWPALSVIRDWLVESLAVPPLAGSLLTAGLWWVASLVMGLALLPLLRQWKKELKEKAI